MCTSNNALHIYNFFFIVSEFSTALHTFISKCIVSSAKSKVGGVNREAAQSLFFKEVSGGLNSELVKFAVDSQLAMWLTLNVFTRALDTTSQKVCTASKPHNITPEEVDIAHYIGGFVVKRLKQRSRQSELEVLETFVDSAPDFVQAKTLLAAKSYGQLTKLTQEEECMFFELEQVFRDICSVSVPHMNINQYKAQCLGNEVIQNCFYSSSYHLEHSAAKDIVLSGIISLYFKVRVHHKCRTIVDRLRAKRKVSSKDRALRSKLSQ